MRELLRIAKKEKVSIVYIPLRKVKNSLWGLYVPATKLNSPTIYLDIELKTNQKLYRLARCILAEELGHHFTGVGSNVFKSHPNYSLKRKMTFDDEKALRWATNKIIPTNEIIHLFDLGICDCYDLANYFGVTVWLLFRKLEFLHYITRKTHNNLYLPLISKIKISCI
jgi:Zn-dependent peptidase ImmA (M78 family)